MTVNSHLTILYSGERLLSKQEEEEERVHLLNVYSLSKEHKPKGKPIDIEGVK